MTFSEIFPIQMLNADQWLALVPLMVMSVTGVLAMLVSPFHRLGRSAAFFILTLGSVISLVTIGLSSGTSQVVLDGVVVVDRIARVFWFLLIGCGLATACMTQGYDDREHLLTEYYSLIAFAVVGMMMMVGTRNLVFLFIALELMSLAVYVLVAMRRQSAHAAEAGLKYFILGGSASAILLYGVTLLYGTTGSLNFLAIREASEQLWQPGGVPVLPALGLGLVGVGFLFKIGAVPFHMWVPDVYTGASTPVSGFMISGVKAAAVGAMLRFALEIFTTPVLRGHEGAFHLVLSVLTVATLGFGSLVGLRQTNVKRLFAYSTIAHSGYLLLGFLALTVGQRAEAADAIIAYTVFYAVMNLGAFAVLTQLSPEGSDELELEHLSGLGKRRPYLAFVFSVFLLSMAGIPPTAGFFGKYFLFFSAVSAGEITLTVLAVLASVISAVFYLRPMSYMYMREEGGLEMGIGASRWFGSAAVVSFAVVLTLVLGLVPGWFSGMVR